MGELHRRAFGGLLRLLFVLGVLLFLAAGTFDYWQAWMLLGVFSAAVLAITHYLVKKDPKLLERRVHGGPGAEKEKKQRVIQFVAQVAFVVVIVFPAIDHRLGWSRVPPYIVLAGNILLALGFLVIFLVFKENTFASATIEVDSEQRVVSTGPYAVLRHPMYVGALVMLLGVPLALGSWWGLLTIIPITAVIIWRLLEEEQFLVTNLTGYSAYRDQVKYRLVPFIW